MRVCGQVGPREPACSRCLRQHWWRSAPTMLRREERGPGRRGREEQGPDPGGGRRRRAHGRGARPMLEAGGATAFQGTCRALMAVGRTSWPRARLSSTRACPYPPTPPGSRPIPAATARYGPRPNLSRPLLWRPALPRPGDHVQRRAHVSQLWPGSMAAGPTAPRFAMRKLAWASCLTPNATAGPGSQFEPPGQSCVSAGLTNRSRGRSRARRRCCA